MSSKITMNNLEFIFKVTYEEANIIIAGLQELPAKIANPLTQKLQKQAHEQQVEPDKLDSTLKVVQ